ncbi:MAG TPA: TIR domain-containing protein, partial [Sphingomicrobium sp.]
GFVPRGAAMADVFVSYKAEDRRRIRPLVEALQTEGLSVWWDEQIGGGAAWRQAIEAELNAAKCVIVIWSNRSVGPEGEFVQDEATRAQQRHVYVPVLIDKVHLPLGFGETQALPLTGWHGNRSDPKYQAVLAAVRRNVGGRRKTTAAPLRQPHVDRRTAIAGGAVAAVAIAGVGGWALLKPSSASAGGIAVLPFANLSGDPRQTYFSDGVAEEIRSALARIAGLKVVGRMSSEAVRNDDTETAAKKLGVANILTGSVRQSPSTIRISAELVDGHTGLDRWSQDYDRAPGDAIKIQTDIAENVASALSATLGTAARNAIEVGGTANAEAQSLVLQMQEVVKGDDKASLEQARGLLDRAIRLDPNYADAYARQSLVVRQLYDRYYGHFDTGRAEALRLANTAIRLAPKLEGGYRARAAVFVSALQLGPALADYNRAAGLAPGDPNVLRDYSNFLGYVGNTSAALPIADRAIAADPLNPESYVTRIYILFGARRFSEAIAESERIKRDSPQLFNWPLTLGILYLAANRLYDAKRCLAQAEAGSAGRLSGSAILAIRMHDAAAASAATDQLKQLFGEAAQYQYAEIDAQRGEKDQAIADLERAWAIKDPGLILLPTDPFLDPIRSDPRFVALVQKMNFPA